MSVWRGPPALPEEAPTAFEGSYRVDSMCNPFPENRDHVKIVTQNDGYDFDCLALGIHCV